MIDSDIAARVLAEIDDDLCISLTRDLVRIPSIFPEERKCAELLADRYAEFGLRVERQEVEAGRFNVLGRISGLEAGRRLLIEGHTDVVALGDEAAWTVDPWGGEIRDGRLYGRGACDMKAGVAAAAVAARAIVRSGIELGGSLLLAGFVDEENLMRGVRHFVQQGGADGLSAAITVEPTFGPGIGTCFCGRARADVTFRGAPGHAGLSPRSGVGSNAVHAAWRLIREIDQRPLPFPPHADYGPSHWQIVSISGGEPNEATVPASCTVRIDARPVPGVTSEDFWRFLQVLLDEVLAEVPGTGAGLSVIEDYGTSGWSTPLDDPLVLATREAYRTVTGVEPAINKVPEIPPGSGNSLKVSTDVHHIAKLGIPCLNIGAGGANAHAADEHVLIEQIPRLARIIALATVEFLNGR